MAVKKSRPSSINICGHTVKIIWHKVKPGEEVANWGLFHPDTSTIELIDWDGASRVMLHELIHAALHYSGHNTNLKNEEGLVQALEYALFPLYKLR